MSFRDLSGDECSSSSRLHGGLEKNVGGFRDHNNYSRMFHEKDRVPYPSGDEAGEMGTLSPILKPTWISQQKNQIVLHSNVVTWNSKANAERTQLPANS